MTTQAEPCLLCAERQSLWPAILDEGGEVFAISTRLAQLVEVVAVLLLATLEQRRGG